MVYLKAAAGGGRGYVGDVVREDGSEGRIVKIRN